MAATEGCVGQVGEAEATCCSGPPVELDSEEGKRRRRELVTQYGNMYLVQIAIAVAAIVSGVATIGIAIPNPSYPFLNCFPLISGLMILIGAIFARRVAHANLSDGIPKDVKKNVTVHYVINVTNCSLSGLSIVLAGIAIGYCFSADPDLRDKCQPMRSVRMAFAVVDVVCGILLLVTCIVTCVLFCRHARMLHGKRQQRLQTLQSEVFELRAQVAALSEAQRSVIVGQAPPPYSEQPLEGVTNTPQEGSSAYVVSSPYTSGV